MDFKALRAKYAKQSEAAKAAVEASKSEEALAEEGKIKADYEKLSALPELRACHICNGTGVERFSYNFQQREQNCEHCDGEGLVRRTAFGTETITVRQECDDLGATTTAAGASTVSNRSLNDYEVPLVAIPTPPASAGAFVAAGHPCWVQEEDEPPMLV